MRLQSRIVWGVLVMGAGTLVVVILAIRFLLAPSSAALPSVRNLNSEMRAPAAGSPVLPACPPAVLQPLQAPSHTGHHKVILTWNASAPLPGPDGKPVGYCLYRSQTAECRKTKPQMQRLRAGQPDARCGHRLRGQPGVRRRYLLLCGDRDQCEPDNQFFVERDDCCNPTGQPKP